MKHLIPVMVILLLISTSFIGISFNIDNKPIFSDKKFYAVRSNYPSGARLIWFDPDNQDILNDIGAWPNSNFPGGGTFSKGYWWFCDNYGNIFRINPETGDVVSIGNSGTGELVDLAWDPEANKLWGITTNNLYSIDLETGAATLENNLNLSFIISITADVNGNLWILGFNQPGTKLFNVDSTTWNVTLFCEGLIINFDKISYEKDEDVIWGIGFNYTSLKTELWQIDIDSCSTIFIGNFQNDTIISGLSIPYNWGNQPPLMPVISGETKGKVGKNYDYCISEITDPDGDSCYVFWDWGNGETSGWIGLYPNGQKIYANHSWENEGTYIIKAKLKDEFGLESEWGSLEVIMPYPYIKSEWLNRWLDRFPLLQRFIEFILHPAKEPYDIGA